jgi:lactoylglutathione lyase
MVRSGWLHTGGAALILALCAAASLEHQEERVELGKFSISLSVKDLAASTEFYEKLGFTVIDGREDENWLVLENDGAVIGIFQDKFEGNLLTFNPPDVRAVQAALRARGIEPIVQADTSTTGPAHIVISDPDGNVVLLDQH